MAFECDLVTATSVDATEFPDLVRQYRVIGVPKTVVNGTLEILGVLPEEEFIETVMRRETASNLSLDGFPAPP
jgi:hypothetical protein